MNLLKTVNTTPWNRDIALSSIPLKLTLLTCISIKIQIYINIKFLFNVLNF